MNNKKAVWNVSIFTGILYFILSLAVLMYLKIANSLLYASLAGVLFTLLMVPAMSIALKRTSKKYSGLEKSIADKILLKANGNIESWKPVRNGNMYITDEGILLVSFDKKPHIEEFISKERIVFIQPEQVKLYIYTDDKKTIIFLTSRVSEIMNVIKENGWASGWNVTFK